MFRRSLFLGSSLRTSIEKTDKIAALPSIKGTLLEKYAEEDKKRKQHSYRVLFPNQNFILHLPSVVEPTKEVRFFVPLSFTKPQIKQYLESIYNVKGIQDVRTLIRKGGKKKRYDFIKKKYEPRQDVKVAIIVLKEEFDLGLPENVRNEIKLFTDLGYAKKVRQQRELLLKREKWEMAKKGLIDEETEKAFAGLDGENPTGNVPGASPDMTDKTKTPQKAKQFSYGMPRRMQARLKERRKRRR